MTVSAVLPIPTLTPDARTSASARIAQRPRHSCTSRRASLSSQQRASQDETPYTLLRVLLLSAGRRLLLHRRSHLICAFYILPATLDAFGQGHRAIYQRSAV